MSLSSITVREGNPKYHSSGNCLIETSTKTLVLGCKTSVIPADGSVTIIGSLAFYRCSGLESIVIPNCIIEIDNDAFSGCTSLTSIVIPDSVIVVRHYVFTSCTALTSVTIGSGVEDLGEYMFDGCSNLTSIIFKNPVGWKNDNIVIDADQLSDPATAATLKKDTYPEGWWLRS
jgi:hypothetical protein